MPTAVRLTQRRRDAFLEALAESANVTLSCQSAGITRAAAYAAKRRDADFAAQWEQAIEMALDTLEAALIRRATEGTQTTQYYQGEAIGTVTNYSDSLAMFLLKSRRPHVYGDLKKLKSDPAPTGDDSRDAALRRLLEALDAIQGKANGATD